jgi:hypothetical protein
VDTEARKGCLLLVFLAALAALTGLALSCIEWSTASTERRIAILKAQRGHGIYEGSYARADRLESDIRTLEDQRSEERRRAASGGGEGEPSSTPWPVLVAILAVTGLVPIGFLVWLIVAVCQGQRIWSCPECKSPAPFLYSCGICGFEMPGFRKLMAFCGIVLVILLLVVVFVWTVLSIESFVGELTPEEEQKAPATSSLPPRPCDRGHPAKGLWCSVPTPPLRQGACACATRSSRHLPWP